MSRNATTARPAEAGRAVDVCELLGSDHVHVEVRRDLRVQLELNPVGAGRLDVAGQLEAPAVDLRSARGLHGRRDFGRRDRAEQTAPVAGARLQRDLQTL